MPTSGETSRPSLRLPRTARLSGRKRFAEVFALKCSASDARVVIFAAANELRGSRIGLVVGKRHGTAVRRHRLKRLLRESFRLAREGLPRGFDFVVVPREGPTPSLEDLVRSWGDVAFRAAGRFTARRKGR